MGIIFKLIMSRFLLFVQVFVSEIWIVCIYADYYYIYWSIILCYVYIGIRCSPYMAKPNKFYF